MRSPAKVGEPWGGFIAAIDLPTPSSPLLFQANTNTTKHHQPPTTQNLPTHKHNHLVPCVALRWSTVCLPSLPNPSGHSHPRTLTFGVASFVLLPPHGWMVAGQRYRTGQRDLLRGL